MSFTEAPRRAEKIRRMQRAVERLEVKAEGGAIQYKEHVQSSNLQDPSDYIVLAADMQREIDKETAILEQEKAEARAFAASLSDPIDRCIILLRFDKLKPMGEVADAIGFDLRYTRKRKSRILRKKTSQDRP